MKQMLIETVKKELNEKFDKTFNDLSDTVKKHEETFAKLKKSKGSEQLLGQETDEEKEAGYGQHQELEADDAVPFCLWFIAFAAHFNQ